eukprot:243429-Rhodomonas_salina.1
MLPGNGLAAADVRLKPAIETETSVFGGMVSSDCTVIEPVASFHPVMKEYEADTPYGIALALVVKLKDPPTFDAPATGMVRTSPATSARFLVNATSTAVADVADPVKLSVAGMVQSDPMVRVHGFLDPLPDLHAASGSEKLDPGRFWHHHVRYQNRTSHTESVGGVMC